MSSVVRLLLTDASLCRAVYTGLATSHQYWLVGPGAWLGARQAVLGIMDRLRYPVNAAAVVNNRKQPSRTTMTTKLSMTTLAVAAAVTIAAIVLATNV